MHLLIALDEDDDRTHTASDAADGGDLDDVIEVMTAGGMRKAHHFVGVHWLPRTRLVAFGPVAAVITLPDRTEQEVRPASTRAYVLRPFGVQAPDSASLGPGDRRIYRQVAVSWESFRPSWSVTTDLTSSLR
jgi:hypothetical protein